jgi:hypothetical protein
LHHMHHQFQAKLVDFRESPVGWNFLWFQLVDVNERYR